MKKFLLKVALPLSIALITNQAVFANPEAAAPQSFGKGNDMIHVTTIYTGPFHLPKYADGVLYLGSQSNEGSCQKLKPLGYVRGVFRYGFQISAPSELFDGQTLDNNSCAIEEFTIKSGASSSIEYKLINDGVKVTAADPAASDLTLPRVEKE